MFCSIMTLEVLQRAVLDTADVDLMTNVKGGYNERAVFVEDLGKWVYGFDKEGEGLGFSGTESIWCCAEAMFPTTKHVAGKNGSIWLNQYQGRSRSLPHHDPEYQL